MKKRILSVLLCVFLMAALLPAVAFPARASAKQTVRPRTTVLDLTSLAVTYYSESGSYKTADPHSGITDTGEGWSWDGAALTFEDGAVLTGGIIFRPHVTVIRAPAGAVVRISGPGHAISGALLIQMVDGIFVIGGGESGWGIQADILQIYNSVTVISGGLGACSVEPSASSEFDALYGTYDGKLFVTGSSDGFEVFTGSLNFASMPSMTDWTNPAAEKGYIWQDTDRDGVADTLTLKECVVVNAGSGNPAVTVPDGAKVIVEGLVVLVGGERTEGTSYGLYCTRNLRLESTPGIAGRLLTVGGKSSAGGVGLGAAGNIVLDKGCAVTAIGGCTAGLSYGVNAASLTVTGGSRLTAVGDAGSDSIGMFLGEGGLELQNAAVTAASAPGTDTSFGLYMTGSAGVDANSRLICASGDSQNGNGASMNAARVSGEVTAIAGNATVSSAVGFNCSGNITLDGGALTGICRGRGSSYAVGVQTAGDLTVSGGELTGIGGKASNSIGVYCKTADKAFTMTGGTVTASGADGNPMSFGLYSRSTKLRISAGELTASGGTNCDASIGIDMSGDSEISGGSVKATAGTGTVYSLGIRQAGAATADSLRVTGGKLEAIGHTSALDRAADVSGYTDSVVITGASPNYSGLSETYVPGNIGSYRYLKVTASSFGDVGSGDWFLPCVDYVFDHGYILGTAPDTFDPNINATRAMVVTILYRLEGAPTATTAATFTDVPDNVWYTNAVAWAAEAGVVAGYDDNTFKPDQAVTREQLCAFVYRYAMLKGLGYDGAWTDDLDFTDRGSLSEYAKEAVNWMFDRGLISGMGDGILAPQGSATRAQFASILYRYLTNLE